MRLRIGLGFMGVAWWLAACASPGSRGELRPIRLPMGFIPNVQYAPFYVADYEGTFAQAGLRIEFDYSLETDAVTLVGSGETPFALASGEQVLLARAQGIPVVYVLAWFQDFPVGVASPSGSGMTSPADLSGRRIGIPGLFGASYIGLRALLAEGGLSESDLVLEAIGFQQVEALRAGQVDGVVVYANNEPIQLEAGGMPVDLIRVSDYVDLASNGLITNEETVANEPDLVRRMADAVVRGLQETLADPDAAYTTSHAYVPGLSEDGAGVQRDVLEASLSMWRADRLGFSPPDSWSNMQTVLLEMGLLTRAVDIAQAFTNDFVP